MDSKDKSYRSERGIDGGASVLLPFPAHGCGGAVCHTSPVSAVVDPPTQVVAKAKVEGVLASLESSPLTD